MDKSFLNQEDIVWNNGIAELIVLLIVLFYVARVRIKRIMRELLRELNWRLGRKAILLGIKV